MVPPTMRHRSFQSRRPGSFHDCGDDFDERFGEGCRRVFGQSVRRRRARAPLAAGAVLASSLFAAGCNAPVAPTFELTFEGAGVASCQASAAEDIRMMCDSKVRVRILAANGLRDLVPPVCQDISAVGTGTMEALSQLDIDFAGLPLGRRAKIQVEVWRSDWLGPHCEVTARPDPIVAEPGDDPARNPQPAMPQPAVLGSTSFEIGRDEHVRVPLMCPDLAQVNRFAAGCGLDVEISDLDRGLLLRQDPIRPGSDRMDENSPTPDGVSRAALQGLGGMDLEELDVQYVLIEETAFGGWQPGGGEWMTIALREDGSAVWRAWPSVRFWEAFTRSRTVCIEVNERSTDGAPGLPQMSCFQIGNTKSSAQRLRASYLSPEGLECLLAARGAGDVPPEGLVIGRVVEPDTQHLDGVQPAANVQVLPTPADLPRTPVPRLAPSPGSGGSDGDDDVMYVSKDAESSQAVQTCHVDDATATTPSGYFISDASFPAHWQTASGVPTPPASEGGANGDEGQNETTNGETPGGILVGGRLPNKVSIVRIQLQ